MIGLTYIEFQEKASDYLNDFCLAKHNEKKTLIVKAPTGSGKTIVLLQFIEKYCYQKPDKVCFVWLTIGTGDLEEQSKAQLDYRLPSFTSKTIDDVLSQGFDDEDVCFINWERVTKKDNKAVMASERKNLFDRISDAKLNGINFILIIDEEHQNNTSKAADIIDAFAAKNTIRVSATAQRSRLHEWYEIDENEVIKSGLITRALYINEGVPEKEKISDENNLLIDLADNKREDIKEQYDNLDNEIKINPLVLIQFPSEKPELIESIEEILADRGKTYDNGLVAIWMADRKENIENITDLDNHVQFLLIKQAISTGWDCPRAKILIKLRENMSEIFELQTLGRLRRMPEARHYDNELLDNAFLFTLDEKYKQQVIQNVGYSYEVKRIFLKPEFKDFTLTKQLRNKDFSGMGEREIRKKFYDFFTKKYGLNNDLEGNKLKFYENGYETVDHLNRSIIQGRVVLTNELANENVERANIQLAVNTHNNAIDLMHDLDSFKSLVGLDYSETRGMFEYFFRDTVRNKEKLLKLNTEQFYAFIINNASKIRDDLREGMSGSTFNGDLNLFPKKEEEFKLPLEEIFKYVPMKDAKVMNKNTYKEYTDECLVDDIRSTSEQLFERWCEQNADWYYKNGDKGQQYFSVVRSDGVGKECLFYADYICMIKGKLWIIETKGGETDQKIDKNVDINVINKFNAFKEYANSHNNINWGFVRDRYNKLYINNENYIPDMDNESWKPLDSILKD